MSRSRIRYGCSISPDTIEVFHRAGGVDAAVKVAQDRRGKQFDPGVVDLFCASATEVLADMDAVAESAALIEAEPGLRRQLTERELDSALEAVADFTDLRSSHRLRLYSYWTERALARPPALARIGAIASLASERLDGSGYHRGLAGAAIPATGRILAAADACQAMSEPRPHRPARTLKQAAAELHAEVRAGRLAADAVDAVLAAAGQHPAKRRTGPAGLTPREIEVLTLIARGASTRQVARALGITAKTAETHIERIYAKIGTSTRSAATLFAMQHGLLDSLSPVDL